MAQSMEKFVQFHETLKESPELKKYYDFMEKVCSKHRKLSALEFSKTTEF